jgi:hypothetical protein
LLAGTATSLITSGSTLANAAGSNLLDALGGANIAVSVQGTAGPPAGPLSMLGLGGTITVVGGTNEVILAPTVSLSLPGSNTGGSVTFYPLPPGVDASGILTGPGASVTLQPTPWNGITGTASPTAPGVLTGYTIGTRTLGSFSAGWGFCVTNCPAQP